MGPLPLVLELHGRGIDGAAFDRWTGFAAPADEAGFVLVMPSAINGIWNGGRGLGRRGEDPDDVDHLITVIDDVMSRLAIDPRRIYVVGMSNGATMAARLACERADGITAIAQVAGTAAVAVSAQCHPARPLPILQIHGTRDRIAPFEGGRARGLLARLVLRQSGGPSIGVDDWARLWVDANGASDGPHTTSVSADTTIRRWRGGSAASDVVFCRVEGGGHTWPGSHVWIPPFLGRIGRGIDATRVIWAFFSGHVRDVPAPEDAPPSSGTMSGR
jgi:polyhydroxybutyrate depolymerase